MELIGGGTRPMSQNYPTGGLLTLGLQRDSLGPRRACSRPRSNTIDEMEIIGWRPHALSYNEN